MRRIAFIIMSLIFSGLAMGQEPQLRKSTQQLQGAQYQDYTISQKDSINTTPEEGKKKVLPNGKWFVGAGLGMSYYIGDHNRQAKIGDMLTPAISIYGGRWITKILGVRVGYAGFQNKGLVRTWGAANVPTDKVGLTGGHVLTNNTYGTGKEYKMKTGEYGELQKYKYMNLHFDLMFDITQLLYEEDNHKTERLDVIPYIGIGWAQVLEAKTQISWSANFGIYTSYRINKYFSAVLDLHAGAVSDDFDDVPGERKGEAAISGTLGVNFHF